MFGQLSRIYVTWWLLKYSHLCMQTVTKLQFFSLAPDADKNRNKIMPCSSESYLLGWSQKWITRLIFYFQLKMCKWLTAPCTLIQCWKISPSEAKTDLLLLFTSKGGKKTQGKRDGRRKGAFSFVSACLFLHNLNLHTWLFLRGEGVTGKPLHCYIKEKKIKEVKNLFVHCLPNSTPTEAATSQSSSVLFSWLYCCTFIHVVSTPITLLKLSVKLQNRRTTEKGLWTLRKESSLAPAGSAGSWGRSRDSFHGFASLGTEKEK